MISFQEIQAIVVGWLTIHGLRTVVIAVGSFLIYKFSSIFIEGAVRKLVLRDNFLSEAEERQREDTLIEVFSGSFHILVLVVAVMMVLTELGIAIGPLVAAAGIAGLAFGFGGQYLIRDIIAGLFIIFENQYRLNDVVSLDGTSGVVEAITLRMTVLRDQDGTVHYVPNGEIKRAANLSKHFSRVNLNIGVSYSSDLDKTIQVINEVGNNLAKDLVWKENIVRPPQFLRVDDFADSAVILKILGETKPKKQWEVAGEFQIGRAHV